MTPLTHRLAVPGDLPVLRALINRAMSNLLQAFLNPEQANASWAIMGLDTQLIDDGTYFVVQAGDAFAGCGGWSRRATLYGGNHSAGRDAALLDPATDPARVRAMYTDPAHVRRGVGRRILTLCEDAARAEGFRSVALAATMPGVPLYTACGYAVTERFEDASGGVPVPLAHMNKAL